MLGGHATGAPRGIPSERWVPVGWKGFALDLPLACQGWSGGRDQYPGAGWLSALPRLGVGPTNRLPCLTECPPPRPGLGLV